MTVADLALLALIGISTLLGLMRGFVGVMASMVAWVLAGWIAFRYGAKAAYWSSDGATPTATDLLTGYGISFFGVLVLVWLTSWVLREMVRSAGLSGLDRSLGMAFGLVRGGFLACLVILLMGYTDLPKHPTWRESRVVPALMPGVHVLKGWMPEWAADALNFGTRTLPDLARNTVTVGKEPFSLTSLASMGGMPDAGKFMTGNDKPLSDSGKDLLSSMQGQDGKMNDLLKEAIGALQAPAASTGNGVLNLTPPKATPRPYVDPANVSASPLSPSPQSDDAFVH